MNKHNAAQYLPFVQALADGKELQRRMGDGSWNNLGDYDFQRPPDYYRIVEPSKPMTTPTQRTPQQASIEAKEAREAWERGELIQVREASYSDAKWLDCDSIGPAFTSVSWQFRPKPPTPRVITPGKWRMRNGLIKEIKPAAGQYPWMDVEQQNNWGTLGKYYHNGDDGVPHSMDLLSRVETKWRPWKPEEVPLGSIVREKYSKENRSVLIHVGSDLEREYWLRDRELLLPDGTYAPCGVEEVVG